MMETFGQSPHKVRRPCENENENGDLARTRFGGGSEPPPYGHVYLGSIVETFGQIPRKVRRPCENEDQYGDLARTRANKRAGLNYAIRPTKKCVYP